jgi:anti-sigma factor RsiW
MGDTDELLGAYVDGELDAENTRAVERLIASDPKAREKVAILRETNALLRAACDERAYASGSPKSEPALVRHPLIQRRSRWAIAASLLILLGVAGFGAVMWFGGQPNSNLVNEIAEYHAVFSHETDHLVEVPAARSDELMRWLGSRIQRRLVAPDLASAGLHFAGGRMLVIDERPVAQLMYTRDRGLPIAVCIGLTDGDASQIRVERRGALRLASWSDGRYGYVVVGELDRDAVRDLAERVKEQLKG